MAKKLYEATVTLEDGTYYIVSPVAFISFDHEEQRVNLHDGSHAYQYNIKCGSVVIEYIEQADDEI